MKANFGSTPPLPGARCGASIVLAGCLALAGCAAPGPVHRDLAEVQPEASPSYDFLVGRHHELEGQLGAALDAYERAVAKDPASAYLQRKVAELAARQGNFEQSLEHAERAFALDPADAEVRLFLGTLYRVGRNLEGAERVLRDEAGDPIGPEGALLLINVYVEAGRPDDALRAARWLVASEPDALRSHLALAGVLERLGRHDEAERALRAVLEEHPRNLSVFSALARVYRERGDREGEIAIHREVLGLYAHQRATLAALAEAQIELGLNEDALATLRELVTHHPGDLRALVRLGALEYELGLHAEAADHFGAAVQMDPGEPEFAYFLGLAQERAGRRDDATASFASIPSDHERYPDARAQLAAIFEQEGDYARALEEVRRARSVRTSRSLDLYLASLQSRAGDFDGAVAFLESLLADAPEDDELLYNLGVLYGEADRQEDALRYMHLALARNPHNASVLNFIGYTWAERGENLEEAERLVLRALELRPEDGFITDSLGWVYYRRALALLEGGRAEEGRAWLERARVELERAMELTGGDPVISEHLGDVYLRMNEKRRALDWYEQALRLEPREDEQPQLLDKLERLRQELGER